MKKVNGISGLLLRAFTALIMAVICAHLAGCASAPKKEPTEKELVFTALKALCNKLADDSTPASSKRVEVDEDMDDWESDWDDEDWDDSPKKQSRRTSKKAGSSESSGSFWSTLGSFL